jgi:P-type Cu+ transporter
MLNDRRTSRSHTATTGGRPKLVSIVTVEGYDDSALLALAASLAAGLETPAGGAILEGAHERRIQIVMSTSSSIRPRWASPLPLVDGRTAGFLGVVNEGA